MFTIKLNFRLFAILLVALSLVFSTVGVIPAQAQAAPAGLSAADWRQIKALLPAATGPNFQQAYIKASNTDVVDSFGLALAVSGDTVVVGTSREDSNAIGVNGNQTDNSALNSGAVYVFTRSSGIWSQQAYLKASNTEGGDYYTQVGDYFGTSVAISGDTLVVGAPNEDSNATGVGGDESNNSAFNAGAAYVFIRSGDTWSQQAYLKASNADGGYLSYELGDSFGASVAISGDTLIVGAPNEDSNATSINGNQADNSSINSGAAYIFTRSGSDWSQQAYLKASNTAGNDYFGISVAISGDTAVAGANQKDNSSGAAYVFTRSGSDWSQQAYLKASNADVGDQFGTSVAISDDTLLVGAPYEASSATGVNSGNESDNSVSFAGAAYVFARSGSDWSQQAYLKASNTGAGDGFGTVVSISGDTLVVGAPNEASNATSSNGNQDDNSASYSGAAYVFTRSGSDWSQQTYLKASNAEESDYFAKSVAISGDTLVIGAPQENSSATGVNGDETNNSLAAAGAAYIFAVDSTAPLVDGFAATSPSTSFNIPITDFRASDNFSVKGYLITTSSIPPAPSANGWSGAFPATYTVAADGNYTLYPWVKDGAGNISPLFISPVSVAVDAPPIVTSIVLADANPTSASTVKFTVKFIEAVTGVDMISPFNDFSITGTGITGASILSVSGSDDTYTVTVKTGSVNGTIRMNVVDTDSIKDSVGNSLGGAGIGNGNYITGPMYNIRVVPSPVFPAVKVTTDLPTYEWTPIPLAARYQYELVQGTTVKYSKIVTSSVCHVASDCYSTPAISLMNGAYKWHVRALINGVWKGYSAYKTFTVAVPPRAGLWKGPGLEFYVLPTKNKVNKFAIYVKIIGCGSYKIIQNSWALISNQHFTFGSVFYAKGTFSSPTTAAGTLGLKSFYIPNCGYLTGGPFPWTAKWIKSAQSLSADTQELTLTSVEQLPDADFFYDFNIVNP